jgi:altronate dehydratase
MIDVALGHSPTVDPPGIPKVTIYSLSDSAREDNFAGHLPIGVECSEVVIANTIEVVINHAVASVIVLKRKLLGEFEAAVEVVELVHEYSILDHVARWGLW